LFGGGDVGLNNYLNDTSALMRDPNYSFNTQSQMIRWINQARRDLAERSGCIRRLVTGQSTFGSLAQPGYMVPGIAQPGMIVGGGAAQSGAGVSTGGDFSFDFSSDFSRGGPGGGGLAVNTVVQNTCMTVPGCERYPYQGFFNVFLQQQYAGCESILDTITCAVNWGGTNRPCLDWWPWDDFQAWPRAYAVLNTSYPAIWSIFNDGPFAEIFMFPIPSQAGEIELDVLALPLDLATDTDPDAIPSPFQRAVKFGAAKLAYLSSGRYAQAQLMEDEFASAAGIARVSVDRGKIPSYYWRM
jgi:hypothetical protein